MKFKKNALTAVSGEPETPKALGKCKQFFMKIGKRNAIIACSILLIGAAVLLNWVLFSGNKTQDGYPNYDQPSGSISDGTGNTDSGSSASGNGSYFSATQVSRQRARDEALEVLQAVVDNVEADETVKAEALAGISEIAEEIQKEANIESLITAKGFAQCVAVLNGDSISIVVAAEELKPAQIAQINEVVYSQTGIVPAGVTIINK